MREKKCFKSNIDLVAWRPKGRKEEELSRWLSLSLSYLLSSL